MTLWSRNTLAATHAGHVTSSRHLHTLAARLEALPEFTLQSTEAAVRALAEEPGIKAAALISPARVALTGQTASPGIFDMITLLGREQAVARLRRNAG